MSDWEQVALGDLQTRVCRKVSVPPQGSRASMSGWQQVTLGDLLTRVRRKVTVEDGVSYPAVSVQMYGRGLGEKEPFVGGVSKYTTLNSVRENDVVLRTITAFEAPAGVARAEHDGAHVSGVFITYEVDQRVLPEFLRLYFQTPAFWDEMQNRASGTVLRRKTISDASFRAIPFALPPLATQARIVEVIDAVDKQITALDTEVDVLDQLWWALGREMAAAVANKGTVPLASFCDISGGLTKNKKDLEQPDLVEVPYLRVANVHRHHLSLSEVATIQTTRAKAEKLRLHAGDVLMNEGGDKDKLGRGHVWEGQIPDCIHQNHVFRVRVIDQRFDPYFVSAWGNTFGREWFETFGTQTTGIASINRATLSRFPVPDVPLSVQQDWAGRLGGVVDTMDALRDQAGKLRATRASLVSGLLEQSISINTESAELEV